MLRYPKNFRESDTIVYFLVYWPFDLRSSHLREERMRGLDGVIFETAVAVPIRGAIYTWNSDGSHGAYALLRRSEGHSVFFKCWTISLLYMWYRFVYEKFYGGKFDACANSVYQALSPQRA